MDDCFCILLSQHKTVTENNERNLLSTEAAARGVLSEKLFLNILQYSQESTVVGVSFSESCRPEALQLYQKETPTQVFFCEYCRIFKNTYFEEHLRKAASFYTHFWPVCPWPTKGFLLLSSGMEWEYWPEMG